jgi:hypothetical protein
VKADSRVFAHRLRDSCEQLTEGEPYWRDVGHRWTPSGNRTSSSRGITPALDLYDENWPIWTYQEQLPPAKFVFDIEGRRGAAIDSMVSGGCIVSGSTIRNSLLFSRVRVHSYCTINEACCCPRSRWGGAPSSRASWSTRARESRRGLRAGIDLEEDRKRFHVTDKGHHPHNPGDARPKPAIPALKPDTPPAWRPSMLTEQDVYLFREGTHVTLYRHLGCQLAENRPLRALRGVGAERARGLRDRRVERLGRRGRQALSALGPLRHLEGTVEGVSRGQRVQVLRSSTQGGQRVERADPIRLYR